MELDSKGFNKYQKVFTIPENAKGILIVCSARGTRGAAWFDDIELISDENLF